MKSVGMLTAVLTLGIAAPAFGQLDPPPWDVGMTAEGLPRFGVHHLPRDHDMTVHRCPSGGACGRPLATAPSGRYDRTRWVDPRAIVAGDVLEVRYSHKGQLILAQRTPAWRGAPKRRSQPVISGAPVAGGEVRATPGTWTDAGWAPGWPRDWHNRSSTGFVACRTAAGTGCDSVGHEATLPLDARVVGRYLFAVTRHWFWAGEISGVGPVPSPVEDLEPPGPLEARSAPVGPVTGPVAVDVRAKAQRRNGRVTVGRVRCDRPCRVTFSVADRKRSARRTLRVHGSAALVVRDRFDAGGLVLKVSLDGDSWRWLV